MAKWYGKIGFAQTVKSGPGVYSNEIVEKDYYGDVIKDSRRVQTSDGVNDNINVSNKISILSDYFAVDNSHTIKYAEYMGAKWKVTLVDVEYPRLVLTLGGVYNEG